MNLYKDKYLKYKKKYINFRNQIAGSKIQEACTNNCPVEEDLYGKNIKFYVNGDEIMFGIENIKDMKGITAKILSSHIPILIDNSIIQPIIQNELDTLQKKDTEWVACEDHCKSTIKKYMDIELNSTHYILSCISNSFLTSEKESNISFISNKTPLTGNWDKDSQHIDMFFDEDIESKKSVGRSKIFVILESRAQYFK